ncbi:helix-turn-helix domain-containing protein [Mycolicibacterium sp. S2-37]|uniref:IclR family transcriptional regulator n=1 Tax=Mycolicibacterium sp. S2-37 TaxID=2810297 RepID=UPI001A94B9BD|nr:helix-turn-helix domain-containing protein [Mycolicibacterium sp. S2-37]MBO0680914.1 helix-turn-helix domain-containing protein [Mycolicibacterium sp. S2-37]
MADPAFSGRSSPPTDRVVAILDFLAGRPEERFGVSELARRVGLTKPTCLGIVTSLSEAGYLVRDPVDKSYRLGPSLITLGHRAQESLRVSPAARQELHRLSARFGVTVALSGVIDDRITLLDLVAPTGVRTGVEVGQSYPFAPPVGLMFVLWDDEATRSWLAKEPTLPLRTDDDRLNRVIAACRADGYLVERLTTGGRRLYALMAGMSATLPDELRALLGELVSDIGERVHLRDEDGSEGRRRTARFDISVISAPVFDHYRRQVMVASMHIGAALTDAEIVGRARALVSTADAVTAQLGGLKPG